MTKTRATAQLALPWEDVPHTVRAALLRGHGGSFFRKVEGRHMIFVVAGLGAR